MFMAPKAQAEANLAAIELIKTDPTRSSETLQAFTGWGSVWQVFNPNPEGWQLNIQSRLRELLTIDEFNVAHASILNAHYTSEEVIRAMWDVVQHLDLSQTKSLSFGADLPS